MATRTYGTDFVAERDMDAQERAEVCVIRITDSSRVERISAEAMFEDCSGVQIVSLPDRFGSSDSFVFLKYMFSACRSLVMMQLPDRFGCGAAFSSANSMFMGCTSLRKVSLPDGFGTARPVSATYMFGGCASLERLLFFEDTFQRGKMINMFEGCHSLRTVVIQPTNFPVDALNHDLFFRELLELKHPVRIYLREHVLPRRAFENLSFVIPPESPRCPIDGVLMRHYPPAPIGQDVFSCDVCDEREAVPIARWCPKCHFSLCSTCDLFVREEADDWEWDDRDG